MGPTVYSAFGTDSLKTGPNAADSLAVSFAKAPGNPAFDWGATRPEPVVYVNNSVDTAVAKWKWKDGKEGHIHYRLPGTLTSATRLRVELNGIPYQGKPIWHRNRKIEFILP